MDFNLIKNYINTLNTGELKELMSFIDYRSRGSELVDSIKNVFSDGYILELKLNNNTSIYASKFVDSDYGTGNIRHCRLKLLNCGEVIVELPTTIVDTFSAQKPYINFVNGGCELLIEKNEDEKYISSTSMLDSFEMSELRVTAMVVSRIISGEYKHIYNSSKNIEKEQDDHISEPETKSKENDECDKANELRNNEIFQILTNITNFVNSDKNIVVYAKWLKEQDEEKITEGHKSVIYRKRSGSEYYSDMKLGLIGDEPVIYFNSVNGPERTYHIKMNNSRNENCVKMRKDGTVIIYVDEHVSLRLTFIKDSLPVSPETVCDIFNLES